MDASVQDLVRRRADNRCEYCLLRQEYSELTHHIEHIVAKQHGGRDDIDNLALACPTLVRRLCGQGGETATLCATLPCLINAQNVATLWNRIAAVPSARNQFSSPNTPAPQGRNCS